MKIELKKEWIHEGRMMTIKPYLNGKLHGVAKWWSKDGNLRQEYNFVNGRTNGVCMCWNEIGIMTVKTDFKDGLINGLEQYWNFKTGLRRWIMTYNKSQRTGVHIAWSN